MKLEPGQKKGQSRLMLAGLIFLANIGFTGCGSVGWYGKIVPEYDMNLISKHVDEQKNLLWEFPTTKLLRAIVDTVAISGANHPSPVPSYLEPIEPPFLVELQNLNDHSLVAIIPQAWDYIIPTAGIGDSPYPSELPSKVKIVSLDKQTGEVVWTKTVEKKGLYTVLETDPVLLIRVDHFSPSTWTVDRNTLLILEPKDGSLLWQNSDSVHVREMHVAKRHGVLVLTKVHAEHDLLWKDISLIEPKNWRTISTWQTKELLNPRRPLPVETEVGILTFEDDVIYHDLPTGRVFWRRSGFYVWESAQPEVVDGILYFISGNKLHALDLQTGQTLWATAEFMNLPTGITISAKRGYVRSIMLKKRKSRTTAIDIKNGDILWTEVDDELGRGNMLDIGDQVFYTTWKRMLARDGETGSLLVDTQLPWKKDVTYHQLRKIDDEIIIENEWNIAAYSNASGELLYHHKFNPMWPAVTTATRKWDEALILGRGEAGKMLGFLRDLTSVSANYAASNAWQLESEFDSYKRRYTASGSSSDRRRALTAAKASVFATEQRITAERLAVFMELSGAIMELTNEIFWLFLEKVHTPNYRFIDHETDLIRSQIWAKKLFVLLQ